MYFDVICGHSLAGIVGLNPAGGVWMVVSKWLLCVVR